MSGLVPRRRDADLAPLEEARHHMALALKDGDVDALLEGRARAEAIEAYLRRRDEADERVLDLREAKLRYERALGILDQQAAPHGVNAPYRGGSAGEPPLDLGVAKATRAAWRRLATLPDREFDQLVERLRATEGRRISATAANRLLNEARVARSTEDRDRKAAADAAAPPGTSTLLHGDCRDHAPALERRSISLVLTDPPYGAGYRSGYRYASTPKAIRGDDDGAVELLLDALTALRPAMADDAHVLVFCRFREEPAFREALDGHAGLALRGGLVWTKGTGMGDLARTFAPAHERLLHLSLPDARMRIRAPDAIHEARAGVARHPTEKPVRLLGRLIRATTNPGDLVADPFAGSGSTLAAAVAAGRNGWGCEIDPDHHATASERLAA